MTRLLFIFIIPILVLTGCGGKKIDTQKLVGNVVSVTLTEEKIVMPSVIPSGVTTFSITNDGQGKHSFRIEGNDVSKEVEGDGIDPKSTAILQLDLKPGTYIAFCPMNDHKNKGMNMTLTVNPK
jgi:uncharacterized cupredoxin-like copper-binding protein